MANQITAPNELGDAEQKRRILLKQGYPVDAVDALLYGEGKSPYHPTITPLDAEHQAILTPLTGAQATKHGMLQEGAEDLASGVDDTATAEYLRQMDPSIGYQTVQDIRETWRRIRRETSVTAAHVISDGVSWWKDKLAKVAGSRAANAAMGFFEPLARPQQALYGAISGDTPVETWQRLDPDNIYTRKLFPKVVIDHDGTKEISPFAATMDAVFSGEDKWHDVKAANAQEGEDRLDYADVMDRWFGAEEMDQLYEDLNNQGLLGKLVMGGMAVSYGVADLFADPLLAMDKVPTGITKMLRAGQSTASRARVLADIADKTKRIDALADAQRAAESHLNRALERHKIEQSELSFQRLQQAERNLAERTDQLNAFKDVQGFDAVNITTTARRHPSTIERTARTVEEVTFDVRKGGPLGERDFTYNDVRNALRSSYANLDLVHRMGMDATNPQVRASMMEEIQRLETIMDNWRRGYRPGRGFSAGYKAETENLLKQFDDVEGFMTRDRDGLLAAGKKNEAAAVEREMLALQRHRTRLLEDGYDAVPEVIEFKGQWIRTRSVEELQRIQDLDRIVAAQRPSTYYQPGLDKYFADETGQLMEQGDLFIARVAQGPDDTEQVAEGLARLVDGASIDDVTIPTHAAPEMNHTPGGRIVPGTVDGLIDVSSLEKRVARMRREGREFVSTVGGTEGRKVRQATVWEDALKAAKKAEADGTPLKFDEGWLPAARPTPQQLMESGWHAEYGANFFDRMSGALYPETSRLKFPSFLRGTYMLAREPMRMLEAMDPGRSWPILRNALNNAESETARLHAVFDTNLQDFGALTISKPSPLRALVVSGAAETKKVHEEASERLFDILNTPRNSDQYIELTKDLSEKQMRAVNNIRQELDFIADRLGITGTDKFIDGYINHAFDPDWFARGGMPPEMKGLSRSGNVFLSNLLNRSGQTGFSKDAVAALDLYSRGVSRKLHVEPGLQQLSSIADQISKERGNFWYRKQVDFILSQVKGEPSLLGRLSDHVVGSIAMSAGIKYRMGAVGRRVMGLSSLAYAGVLAGSPRYPIMSLATALTTTGARYGMLRTSRGLFAMGTPEGQALFHSVGGTKMWEKIFEHATAVGRAGEAIDRLTRFSSNLRFAGMPSIHDTENFIRGMTFHAALDETLTKLGFESMEAATKAGFRQKVLFDALRTTEEVNHYFGVAAKPAVFSRISKSGAAVGTQFLSFGPKQTEQLLAMGTQDPGRIFRYMAISGWMSRVAAFDLGIDINQYVGMGYMPSGGVRDVQTPGVEWLGASVDMMAAATGVVTGTSSKEDFFRAGDEFGRKSEALVPYLNAFRTRVRAIESIETGEQSIPGQGVTRQIDMEVGQVGPLKIPYPTGPRGERGEAVAVLSGAKSVEESLHQEARRQVRAAVDDAAFERFAAIEDLWEATQSGDFDRAMSQLSRLQEMGVPVGDVSTPMKARAEAAQLYWFIEEIRKNPKLAHKIVPIMEQYGILGRDKDVRQP